MRKIKIQTITPVHIGSGRELSVNTEFLVDKGICGVIDDKKVLNIIKRDNLINWIATIDRNEDLMKFIRKFNSSVKIQDVASRVMDIRAQTLSNKMKEHMFSGSGSPIIPGSSLKGSIRTAVFNHLILQKYKSPLSENDLKKGKKYSDKQLMRLLLGDNSNNDVFRFLKLGDAHFSDDTIVLNMQSLNEKKQDIISDSSKSQLTECIEEDSEAVFSVKIDEKLLDANIEKQLIKNDTEFLNYSNLFRIINQYNKRLIDEEIDNYEELKGNTTVDTYLEKMNDIRDKLHNLDENECILRIGHGSGWIWMTGAWPKEEKLVGDDLWEAIVFASRPKNKFYKDFVFPKTRRMDAEGNILGFVKLELL